MGTRGSTRTRGHVSRLNTVPPPPSLTIAAFHVKIAAHEPIADASLAVSCFGGSGPPRTRWRTCSPIQAAGVCRSLFVVGDPSWCWNTALSDLGWHSAVDCISGAGIHHTIQGLESDTRWIPAHVCRKGRWVLFYSPVQLLLGIRRVPRLGSRHERVCAAVRHCCTSYLWRPCVGLLYYLTLFPHSLCRPVCHGCGRHHHVYFTFSDQTNIDGDCICKARRRLLATMTACGGDQARMPRPMA